MAWAGLRLYQHAHVGTKALIERYIDSVQKTLSALLDISARQGDRGGVQSRLLLEQLLATRQSFGRSALLLSGGGTFGMNHTGVVKSLWGARLLPRIISGTSAGSIVCAVLCTKTDAEVPAVLEDFCYGDLEVFDKTGQEEGLMSKAARFLKYGSLFDISHLVRVMRNRLGDITFQEAYNRTRRILNITVSSANLYELPRLLNYVTAPNVMIWSAVYVSAGCIGRTPADVAGARRARCPWFSLRHRCRPRTPGRARRRRGTRHPARVGSTALSTTTCP